MATRVQLARTPSRITQMMQDGRLREMIDPLHRYTETEIQGILDRLRHVVAQPSRSVSEMLTVK